MINNITDVYQIENGSEAATLIPYVSVQEAARIAGVNADELVAFIKQHDLPAFKFEDDFLFLIPSHFKNLVKLMELAKRQAKKCTACGRGPSMHKEAK